MKKIALVLALAASFSGGASAQNALAPQQVQAYQITCAGAAQLGKYIIDARNSGASERDVLDEVERNWRNVGERVLSPIRASIRGIWEQPRHNLTGQQAFDITLNGCLRDAGVIR